MTIYCKESYFFGLINKERKLDPGVQVTLSKAPLITRPRRDRRYIGTTLTVESDDLVTVRSHGIYSTKEYQYSKTKINEIHLKSDSVTTRDIMLGISREYLWKPESPR